MSKTGLRAIPTVTIGMPVYNGERFIREALDSALAQTFGDFDLLISDNASSDDTQKICTEYAASDARIRYIRHDINRGSAWNFNFVAQNASGEIFSFFAHDDVLCPDFLEVTVGYLLQNKKTVLVSGDFKVIDEGGADLRNEQLVGLRDVIDWRVRIREFFTYPVSNAFFCIYGTMRTEVCRSVMASVREPRFAGGSEIPILARFAVAGEIASVPRVLRRYRQHSQSVYLTETALINAKHPFRRFWIDVRKRIGLQGDQLYVALLYRLPFADRMTVLAALSRSVIFSAGRLLTRALGTRSGL